MSALELLNEHACFGGVQRFYRHPSYAIGLPMQFGLYLPPQAFGSVAKVPLLVFLAGLTCNEETFAIKAGAQCAASRLGLAILTPDTSPRGTSIPGQADSWDFALGAGFYLDATRAPWSENWRMESYITQELHQLVLQEFPLDPTRVGIFGHSMGGHGALTLALRHPNNYRSLSAFAPIAAPMSCPWGQKAFTGYFTSESEWSAHDASALMASCSQPPFPKGILIDQGLADKFLTSQLHPQQFQAACQKAGQALHLRMHEGYDHGYYFIQSFATDHLEHHARALRALG